MRLELPCMADPNRASDDEIGLQRRADLRAGPMQEHSLVDLADVEGVADLLRRPALDVAQDDDLALARGQCVDGRANAVDRLAADQALVGTALPVARCGGPVPGPAAVPGRQEALRVDRILVRVRAADARERGAAGLALAAGLRAVGQDAEQPRL